MAPKQGRSYVIILNWNGWKDTVECLESVFRNYHPDYRVVVCDNGSQDGSLDRIRLWAEGKLDPEVPVGNPMRRFSFPPVPKPIAYREHDRTQAEAGGDSADVDARLILIQVGANLGFAGGNNVGLRYALARNDFEYAWLLNNDTVIKPDALVRTVQRMQEKPSAGLCGSTIIYYHKPNKLQVLGGFQHNRWLGTYEQFGHLDSSERAVDRDEIERKMDGVQGASVLVSKAFLKDIGVMSEEYFLYFEEQDWAFRGKGKYTLAYAPESVVYHKEGATAWSESTRGTSYYYAIKNRLVFTRKFFPVALPTVYMGLFVTLFNRVRRREWDRLRVVLRIMSGR